MFAAIWSHEAVLEVLLKKGVDPDDPDKVSVHSLHIYNHYSLLSQYILSCWIEWGDGLVSCCKRLCSRNHLLS
jgi:hypothetical protein